MIPHVFREIPLFENYSPATRGGEELIRPSLAKMTRRNVLKIIVMGPKDID